jgi:hypothetical protein
MEFGPIPEDRAYESSSAGVGTGVVLVQITTDEKSASTKIRAAAEFEIRKIDAHVVGLFEMDTFERDLDIRVSIPPFIPCILPTSCKREKERLIVNRLAVLAHESAPAVEV